MSPFRQATPIDDYVLDVLMRDIVGHDQQPAAFLVYLFLYGRAARQRWQPIKASLRTLADATGLSKSAVQSALPLCLREQGGKCFLPAVGEEGEAQRVNRAERAAQAASS